MRLQDREDLGALVVALLIPDMIKDGIILKGFDFKKMTPEEREKIQSYVKKKIDEQKEKKW